ncbi:hypothetical protein GGTG_04827 [Gaeumannomyces tritici R3-111a-1]|uniref:Uncharacterized protein n=1 Tax=Gaeumannomyces tritici (strain R3-111a-1) TaxID=644352 RepID=J3NU72_GAET3|nr:hypothetical protein GGTG_04827 [Gaeumannomyces tritici R3-111a-1]EJT79743.1 hypothetical protein GGTG_04827 [Gaeumannomyces tritici R3-111a-1]
MRERNSTRSASKRASKAIATMAGVSKNRQGGRNAPLKCRRSKKTPSLPKGKLSSQQGSHLERIANARAATNNAKTVAFADDPIQRFNDLEEGEKEGLMKSLLLGYSRLLYSGCDPRPADLYDYRRTGRLPATDRAVLRGALLCVADEDDDNLPSKAKPKYPKTKIHGQDRWEPCRDISGACSCSIEMDADGRVDLGHDAYCLRKHFSTRWAVPCDQFTIDGPPKSGATVSWGDSDMVLRTEGKESDGFWVDIQEKSWLRGAYTQTTRVSDLISLSWLLQRIIATFEAPPCTKKDGYKCTWSFTLWNVEDPTCALVISDHKGCPQAWFRGGKKASNEALQLLQWLAGTNCPHPYDYTPCGMVA